jgi:hypothetical protein
MFGPLNFFQDDMQAYSVYNSDLFVETLINIWCFKNIFKNILSKHSTITLFLKSKFNLDARFRISNFFYFGIN